MSRKRTTFKGRLRISRPTGGERDVIKITIEDETSRVQFIEAEVSLDGFAKAITGHSDIPITFELARPELVGSKAENKTALVPFERFKHQNERYAFKGDDYEARTPAVVAALKPFEVDGWKARVSDMWNGHCTEAGFQRVVFFRHVKDGKPVK